MTQFLTLSVLVRTAFALWAFLLCLADLVSAILSRIRKRRLFFVAALILFAPAYFAWQTIFDLALANRGIASATPVTQTLCGLPFLYWFAVLSVLTVVSVLLLRYGVRYEKNHITRGAIKSFLDQIPCGVCCYRENGRILFSNIRMNRLCVALTDSPLLNGKQLSGAVGEKVFEVEGRMWRFTGREMHSDGERLYEIIASDVTNEYAKTQVLEKDKAELSRINRELREYTLSIDETVRRQEILQAKISVHDEMNRLMLTTVAAEPEQTAQLDRIFSLWERNALLLRAESDDAGDGKTTERIGELADALRIGLNWQGSLPAALSGKERTLFFAVAQEAVINAAKHAKARSMNISFDEAEGHICCRFTNDGEMPRGPVTFTGGLANLEQLAQKQGATIVASADGKFTLSLLFPVSNKPIG